MRRVLIFGTGSTGRRIYNQICNEAEVIGFLDNNKEMWGEELFGLPVLGDSSVLGNIEFDEILICSLPGLNIIKKQLIEVGVAMSKINSSYIDTQVNARINFIKDWVSMIDCEELGMLSVAEGGVFQGEFAKEINELFPKQKLFLFDTFEGFDQKDVDNAKEVTALEANHLANTSVELVLNKLPYKENAIIKKGYFPDTAQGVDDERFIFVNLDFDLYNPIYEGLKFFYPRLIDGGCMLVHDYFNPGYKGVAKAIADYEKQYGKLIKFPIGDHCSIGIIKKS